MHSTIGASVKRLEDEPLLRGEGRFIDDLNVPGMAHVAFLRSPHPHAAIRSIVKDAALAMPGVLAVLTFEDIVPLMTDRRMSRVSNTGIPLGDRWMFALADGEVAYVGEPVAMVLAESRYLAEDAAAAIEVDYELLPFVADAREAAAGPPTRSDLKSNVVTRYNVGFGDVDKAFASAAHIFKRDLWQHRGSGHSIETRGTLVEVRAKGDGITVHASTQKAHDLQQTLTSLMDFDEGLRVVAPDIGGGFGPKLCVYSEDIALVAAAKLTGRSLKWIEDRREYFTNAIHERDQYWTLEIATNSDARILGVRGTLLHDMGAYAIQDPNIPYNSSSTMSGPYVVPALNIEVTIVSTNKTPVSSVRGAGYPQAAFSMERMMDLVARELKLDRAEVRTRNLIPGSKMPYTKPIKARSGLTVQYDSGDYPACHAQVLDAIDWAGFPARQQKARAEGRYLGIGLSHGVKGSGRGPFESALVRVSRTGRITVFTGASAMGQGLATAMAQIAAAELGVSPSDVKIVAGDTGGVSLGLGGFASRQTVTAGNSVALSARAVAEKAKKVASHMLEADEGDLELADGSVRVVGAPDLAVKLKDIARVLQGAPGYSFPAGVDPGLEADLKFRTDALCYANGCHACEVEVDPDTGEVTILRYISLQDSGVRINPMMVEGQIHGGIVHAIGNAFFEWMGYDDQAQPVTTNYADYLLPTATEIPRLETLYRETRSPLNPLGVKGVGEAGTIPAAAALISAVEDALSPFGVRIDHQPVTPMQLVTKVRASAVRDAASAAGG